MSVIELTTFTVKPDQTQAMLDARKGVPVALSRSYLEKATVKAVDVRLVEVPSAGHFDVIDPQQPSWANVRQWIAGQVGRQESGEPR
jgi:hypothetical protein